MKYSKFGFVSLCLGYTFLYAPILFLVIFSFNESQYPGIWTGFSLKWYRMLFGNVYLFNSIINSFKIATIAATIAVTLGTLAAISLLRTKKKYLGYLFVMPLATPEVITGFSLLLLFVAFKSLIGWPNCQGMTGIIIAHTTLAIGYVLMIVQSRLKEFDIHLEEAALDLGASPLQVFFQITFPIIMPALLSGWLLSFALSLDDVVLASFLAGPGSTTLPLLIFSNLRMGVTPEINALATLIILSISFIITILAGIFLRKNS